MYPPYKSKSVSSLILSTDSEFHSFHRQSHRLAESKAIDLNTVNVQPFDRFSERVTMALQAAPPDVLFLSHVFFNSGFRVTDLNRIFFLAGGYMYAQAGEGVCFAHVPTGCELRPAYTGWFAKFGELDKPRGDKVRYASNGMRFAGATMDFSALYRLRAVFDLSCLQYI